MHKISEPGAGGGREEADRKEGGRGSGQKGGKDEEGEADSKRGR